MYVHVHVLTECTQPCTYALVHYVCSATEAVLKSLTHIESTLHLLWMTSSQLTLDVTSPLLKYWRIRTQDTHCSSPSLNGTTTLSSLLSTRATSSEKG